jgi:hypothetical protein
MLPTMLHINLGGDAYSNIGGLQDVSTPVVRLQFVHGDNPFLIVRTFCRAYSQTHDAITSCVEHLMVSVSCKTYRCWPVCFEAL